MSVDLVMIGSILLGGLFFVAGLSLMLGLFVTPASLGLILFTIVASGLLLNFWDKQGEERIGMTNAFQTNLGIIGGLMLTAAHGLQS